MGALTAVLIVGGAVVEFQPWSWPWEAMWAGVRSHVGLLALGAGAGLGSARAIARFRAHRHSARGSGESERHTPWVVSYPGIATMVATVTGLGIVALVVMLQVAATAVESERPRLQVDAIKYGLGVFAGAGAVAALLLGIRRQQHLERAQEHVERAQRHTEADASERRVTDIYTKAVEQLGSADAAVRLGSLYALQRVAEDNPKQQQPIADVLCAYLRMPFTPPSAAPDPPSSAAPDPLGPDPVRPDSGRPDADAGRDPYQELQVRLTAQKILTEHIRPGREVERGNRAAGGGAFWPEMDLDLTGARLVDWDMAGARVRSAVFRNATWAGAARFDDAVFDDVATFSGATFHDDALFRAAVFRRNALFGNTTFKADCRFENASFRGAAAFGSTRFNVARFIATTFAAGSRFSGASFAGGARFEAAVFDHLTRFDDATFSGTARFSDATFRAITVFKGVQFRRTALFRGVTFLENVTFSGAHFFDSAGFSATRFEKKTLFDGTTFARNARFHSVIFAGDATFILGQSAEGTHISRACALDGALVITRDKRDDRWPPGWAVAAGDADGLGRLQRAPVL
ncbi:hypothetical protein Ahu01nite_087790 [Winogradskya humida]|uniref:Pentapeptide repeat protein n=1 Tax=Winogradskya humida TaxID=113566 RepID=A0ABQ4A4B5_9ACTN|nr:hypothetical protein Ahu01nite_087790 [Actinoplanes humidus]